MNRRSLADFTALGLFWGSSYSLIAVGLEKISPLGIAQIRLLGGAAVLICVLMANSKERRSLRLTPRLALTLLGLGMTSTAIPYLLIAWGETRAPSAIAGMLGATTPIFTAIMAPLILRERVGMRRSVGVGLGLLGVILIFHPWSSSSLGNLLAESAVVLAAALYGLSFIYLKRFVYATGATTLAIATGQVTLGGLALLVLDPSGPSVLWHAGLKVDLAVITLGVVQTGFAAILSVRLVESVPTSVSSSVTYLIAVVSVFEGYFFNHQRLGLIFFIGALVTMVGLVVTSNSSGLRVNYRPTLSRASKSYGTPHIE